MIRNGYVRRSAVDADADARVPPFRRILDDVLKKVDQRLNHGIAIERQLDRRVGERGIDLEIESTKQGPIRVDRLSHGRDKVHTREVVALGARVDSPDVEHVVDEMGEPLALAPDDPIELAAFDVVVHDAALQRLAEHADQRQWRLQFVADV